MYYTNHIVNLRKYTEYAVFFWPEYATWSLLAYLAEKRPWGFLRYKKSKKK